MYVKHVEVVETISGDSLPLHLLSTESWIFVKKPEKLNTWKLIFWIQPIIARDEIKVNVIQTNKYKIKAKNFVIPIFYFPVSFLLYIACCNTSNISFFILISFLFEDIFKASKEQVTINEWYTKVDILVSRGNSAASNPKRQVEVRCNSIFAQNEPIQFL